MAFSEKISWPLWETPLLLLKRSSEKRTGLLEEELPRKDFRVNFLASLRRRWLLLRKPSGLLKKRLSSLIREDQRTEPMISWEKIMWPSVKRLSALSEKTPGFFWEGLLGEEFPRKDSMNSWEYLIESLSSLRRPSGLWKEGHQISEGRSNDFSKKDHVAFSEKTF